MRLALQNPGRPGEASPLGFDRLPDLRHQHQTALHDPNADGSANRKARPFQPVALQLQPGHTGLGMILAPVVIDNAAHFNTPGMTHRLGLRTLPSSHYRLFYSRWW